MFGDARPKGRALISQARLKGSTDLPKSIAGDGQTASKWDTRVLATREDKRTVWIDRVM